MTLLGIDIGGTGIKGAPVDVETGTLLAERFRIPTPQPALPNAVADVVGQIAAHFDYHGPAGVTFPAIVKHGVIYSAANVDKSWVGTNAGELFTAHVGGLIYLSRPAPYANRRDQHDWRIGVSRQLGAFDVHLNLSGGGPGSDYYNGRPRGRTALVVGATRSF